MKLKILYRFFLILTLSNLINGQSLVKNISNINFSSKVLVRDTLYTHSDYIIEVYIPEQKIYLHLRDGRIIEFLCSTGNPKLEKGVTTPEGIFVIQNKARKVYSTQFDSTLMINWLGFNFNIGFHALQGNSYYRHLGKRVSSHGCIRISRETSEYFFNRIPIGTPVFVHSGKSARVIAFARKDENYVIPSKNNLNLLLKENLKSLYHGHYLYKHHKLVISEFNVSHKGLELGDESKISPQVPLMDKFKTFHLDRRLFEVQEQ